MLRHSCPLFSDMSWYKGSLCYDIVVPPFLICHGIEDIYICYDIVVPLFLIWLGIQDLYVTT